MAKIVDVMGGHEQPSAWRGDAYGMKSQLVALWGQGWDKVPGVGNLRLSSGRRPNMMGQRRQLIVRRAVVSRW